MKNRKLSLVESPNIEKLRVDNKKYEMILQSAEKIAKDTSFDPEVLSYVELDEENFTHLCLVNFADIHFFDQGMQKKRFDLASDFLKNTSNAYGVLSGDTFTVSTLSGASNAHVNKINNTNSAILGKQCLSKISDKILFGVGGNHDGEHGSRNRDSNISLTRNVLDSINVSYFQYNVLLKMNFNDCPFYVFVTHGCGKANSKASALDVMKAKCSSIFSRFGIYPNLVLSGHFHADVNGRYIVQVPVYKNGQLVATKNQELIIESAPALQGDSEFTTAYNMDMTKPNVNAFDISFKKNPYFNTKTKLTESPIIWTINKFPLLRHGKDELSTPAKIYMEKYKEPIELKGQIDKLINETGLNLDGLKQSIQKLGEEVKEF
ncbi:MAG: hypothetical protein E7359_00715 [Clostridiales bacterium]|nr:hypothetical protein [Clostridiales bacterium]